MKRDTDNGNNSGTETWCPQERDRIKRETDNGNDTGTETDDAYKKVIEGKEMQIMVTTQGQKRVVPTRKG